MGIKADKGGKLFGIALLAVPLIVALIYILPPLYVYYSSPAPEGKEYSQFALDQLYNYDEYGFYLVYAKNIAGGGRLSFDATSYEGGSARAMPMNFGAFYVIAAFVKAVRNIECVMPVIDAVFAVVLFFSVYFFVLCFIPSRRAAMLASVLTLLPLPALRPFEAAQQFAANGLSAFAWNTSTLPLLSRTYAPQMTFPLLLLFLLQISRIMSGDESRRPYMREVAAACLLGLFSYMYTFTLIVAGFILVKCIAAAILTGKKSAARRLVLIGFGALIVALPCLANGVAITRMPYYADLDRYFGVLPFDRFALKNIANFFFFAAMYVVYLVPGVKKYVLAGTAIAVPVTLAAIFHGVNQEYFYFITPAFYLAFAAALPRSNPAWPLFFIMAGCLEPSLLLRYVSGKTHADVYYFYHNHFLQFAPMFVVVALWGSASNRSGGQERAVSSTPAGTARLAFAPAVAFILLAGAMGAVGFAKANSKNYFEDKGSLEAIRWLGRNAPADSVALSMDMKTNTEILLMTRCKLYLPKAGLSSLPLDNVAKRLALAANIIGTDPELLRGGRWSDWGYYLFSYWTWTQTKEFKAGIRDMYRRYRRSGAGEFRLDYVFYGPAERKLSKIDPGAHPYLRPVFRNSSVTIYEYRR